MAGDDEPQPSPRRIIHDRSGDSEDETVRDMFLRAGYDVESDLDIRNYADDMAFVRERREARHHLRLQRAKAVIWLFGSIGVAVIGALVTFGAQWLRLLPR